MSANAAGVLPVLTKFDRIGGEAAVARLVDAFYHRMETLPQARTIRAMHPSDLSNTKDVLRAYFAEWLGGPAAYSQACGHPRLRMRHARVAIGPSERDAWMLCMDGALDEVVGDPEMRAMLHNAFLKLADWVRNDPENPHDHR